MTESAWTGPEDEAAGAASFERQLALVDRIFGLESQVARLSAASTLAPSEQLLVERELARLRSTMTWRTGRIVSAPLRAALRIVRRGDGA